MNNKTKKIIKTTSCIVTVLGVTGLVSTGASGAEVDMAVQIGTGIATIIASFVSSFLTANNK